MLVDLLNLRRKNSLKYIMIDCKLMKSFGKIGVDNDNNGIDAFTLPISWKLGTDLVSKLLLNDQKIINLIAKSFLGMFISLLICEIPFTKQ